MKSIRDYQLHTSSKGGWNKIYSKFCVLRHKFWSVVSGVDIPLSNLGGEALIPHPNGIVIYPSSIVGGKCLIHQQVTIGVKRGDETPPSIGRNVGIGAGAKIFDPMRIGDNVLVGANAVVVKDVESGFIVGCITAKAIG
ncbi:serine acetyltransferase [Cycloclasticus pugetii]|uniref:serine acetyltransferase n=1 Tax=Cycloclasticus pugetii TaxID=34068 RepID=UPI0039E5882E